MFRSDVETREDLIRALEIAARKRLNSDQLHKQRVSYILGALSEEKGITRERIEQVLATQEGKSAA